MRLFDLFTVITLILVTFACAHQSKDDGLNTPTVAEVVWDTPYKAQVEPLGYNRTGKVYLPEGEVLIYLGTVTEWDIDGDGVAEIVEYSELNSTEPAYFLNENY